MTLTSYFASGTGAAGLVGAFLWWEIRGLGVRIGVGLSSVRPILSVMCFVTLTSCISKVLPFVIPLTYFLLLPRPHAFSTLVLPEIEEFASSRSEYAQLPASEEDAGVAVVEPVPLTKALSIGDKWQLLKPMIPRYMMPLCKCVVSRFIQFTHVRGHVVFVYLVSFLSLYFSPFIQYAFCEVRIHHQPRRCAYTHLPHPYIRVVSSFWTHCIFYSGLLSSLAGVYSFTLLSTLLNRLFSLCIKALYFSLAHLFPLVYRLFQRAQFQYLRSSKGSF